MNKIILGKPYEEKRKFSPQKRLNLLFSFVSIVVKEFN
jgi:hypothetical protein